MMGAMQGRMLVPLLFLVACATARPEVQPVVVLYEFEPWALGPVAAQNPVFVLYDDGNVIYLERSGGRTPEYMSVRLDDAERRRIEAVLTPEFAALHGPYSLIDMPGQASNLLHVWREGRRQTVDVYGDLGRGSTNRESCPKAFLDAYDAMRRFEHPNAERWTPRRLVVRFSEGKILDPPVPWPDGWPDLDSPETEKEGHAWTIYLGFQHLEELAAMWPRLPNSHADVEIDGRQGMISYRYEFPGEKAWKD